MRFKQHFLANNRKGYALTNACRVCFVIVAVILCPLLAYADFTGKVVGVIDGDSIRVMHEGKAEKVRLAGIDCPERKQAFGTKAKQATSNLSFGKAVYVEPIAKDRYGRTVAFITLPDGVRLNEELVKEGMCWWYRKYAPHNVRLKELEAVARGEKRGLWVEGKPVPPWEFRTEGKVRP